MYKKSTKKQFTLLTFFGAGIFAADVGALVVRCNSVDIEVTKFKGQTNSPDLTKVKTFVFWNKRGYDQNVYVDNIYAYKTSDPVSIISDKAIELSVYPNSFVDKVFVESVEDINLIEVFNTIGERLKVQNENCSQSEIDFSNLDNGIYFLKISLENGSVVTKKILKQ